MALNNTVRIATGPTAMVRTSTLMGFSELLHELGCNPLDLLQELELQADFLELPDFYMSFDLYCLVMEKAAVLTQVPEFGLILGKRQSVAILGAFGFAMQQSNTVRDALEIFERYYHTHNQSARLSNHVQDGIIQVTHQPLVRMPSNCVQAKFKTISVTTNILKLLCGADWKPIEVWFNFAYNGNHDSIESLLEAPVSFDSAEISVFYEEHYIEREIPNNDPNLRNILANYLQLVEEKSKGRFTSIVYSTIRSALSTDLCSKGNVANFLGMSARTLQRKLSNEGSSFQALLTSARMESAKNYLQHTSMTVTEVAEMVGYSELSVFSRAFKFKVGKPPLTWRADLRELSRIES